MSSKVIQPLFETPSSRSIITALPYRRYWNMLGRASLRALTLVLILNMATSAIGQVAQGKVGTGASRTDSARTPSKEELVRFLNDFFARTMERTTFEVGKKMDVYGGIAGYRKSVEVVKLSEVRVSFDAASCLMRREWTRVDVNNDGPGPQTTVVASAPLGNISVPAKTEYIMYDDSTDDRQEKTYDGVLNFYAALELTCREGDCIRQSDGSLQNSMLLYFNLVYGNRYKSRDARRDAIRESINWINYQLNKPDAPYQDVARAIGDLIVLCGGRRPAPSPYK